MKAVVYKGPREVSVDTVPDASIEKPIDVVVRMTMLIADDVGNTVWRVSSTTQAQATR